LKTALIVLGHGSRVPEATETLAAVTEMVRVKTDYDLVAYASLQFSEPGLESVVHGLAKAEMKRIMVVPFLIATGQHMKVDIPDELANLREKYPGIERRLGNPLGADFRLAEILIERAREMENSN